MNQPTTDTLNLKERLNRGTDAAKFAVTSGLVITFVMVQLVDLGLSFLGALFSIVPTMISGTAVIIGLSALSAEVGNNIKQVDVEILNMRATISIWLLGGALAFAALFSLFRAWNVWG